MLNRCALGAVAVTLGLLLASTASADTTTIGSVGPTVGPGTGCSGCHALQFATDAASPAYVVPAPPAGGPWTLTSWSARGGFDDGAAAVEVWRATGTPNEFQLVAIGPEQPFPADTVMSYPESLAVQPGDHLGVRNLGGEFPPTYDDAFAADVVFGAMGDPMVGQTIGAPTSDFNHLTSGNRRINAAATLSAPSVPVQNKTKKKCKRKKKHKRSAESAKKKKCKKHKRK